MSLKDIKAKIKSVDRTMKVTKAMEAVSAVKMRKSQVRALTGRPYARAALAILSRLAPSLVTLKHPLTEMRSIERAALIVVTSDKGLCGTLNAGVLKVCDRTWQQELFDIGIPKESVDVYAFGKKSAEHYARRGFPIKARYDNVADDVPIADIEQIARTIAGAFAAEDYDRVFITYTEFKSTFEQAPVTYQLLPLHTMVLKRVVEGIAPVKGAMADTRPIGLAPAAYTVEPEADEVLGTLLPRLVSVIVYHALLESKASEHSARMVAMKNASDKSRDLSKALSRKFNKARQAAITREVSEIVGGIEAMATN